MSTSAEPAVHTPSPSETKTARIAKIVRWAARVTSVPIFGLLMVSLVPALASFAISAKDDKITTLGMCAAGLGYLLGWRWAGIGGALAGLGVAAMLSQADGPVFADPFAVAFGLQAILFLISWSLNSNWGKATTTHRLRIKAVAVCLLVISAATGAFVIYRGPGPTPVPKEKEIYLGTWQTGTGFSIQINADGRANVSQDKEAKVESCNTPLNGIPQSDFLVTFPADDRLELTRGPLQPTKLYHIDRRPFHDHNDVKMVLNGSDPYLKRSGMLLVKQQTPQPKALPPGAH